MIDRTHVNGPDGRVDDASDPDFWIPPCPYRPVQVGGGDAARICDDEACCRCASDVERALRAAIRRVLGDIAAKSALGIDKKSAVVAIARAGGAAFGCKSLARTVHPRWSREHVAVHGELPSDRTMRRWYRESFEDHPDPGTETGGDGFGSEDRGSAVDAGTRS